MTLIIALLLLIVILLLAWSLLAAYRSLLRLERQARLAWEQMEAAFAERHSLAKELEHAMQQTSSLPGNAVQPLANALAHALQTGDQMTRCQNEAELNSTINAGIKLLQPAQDAVAWQNRLKAVNHRIEITRIFYNDQALVFNTRMGTMPLALAAKMARLKPARPAEGEETAEWLTA